MPCLSKKAYLCRSFFKYDTMYIDSFFNYQRHKTFPVQVSDQIIGGSEPICLQSMANTDTNNVAASVAQAKRIAAIGGQIVRFTTQGQREVQSLAKIRQQLRAEGCNVPLAADVHFNADVAVAAAACADKVRINPGNFVPGKRHGSYTEAEAQAELNVVRTYMHKVITACRDHNTALRIGVNHGSMAPRILNFYGDTPEGLAESCMEMLHMCREESFNNVVLSIKASNVLVMVHAVRLLVERMNDAGMHFPLHLGVTEAGNGEDGRVKSAVGIGALLADGIGDTIRVSLSEAPECEIPIAAKLTHYITNFVEHVPIEATAAPQFNPYVYTRRKTLPVRRIGGDFVPVVIGNKSNSGPQPDLQADDLPADMLRVRLIDLTDNLLADLKHKPRLLCLHSDHTNPIGEMRASFHRLLNANVDVPVIIERNYTEDTDLETLQIKAAVDIGSLLIDGFGDGLWLRCNNTAISDMQINSLAFNILQATRVRFSHTEYIACPGCGRTMFDLSDTLNRVKTATANLKGLKIAVMGCIVNGPGEMADADYGYVGAARGCVTLYRRKECVEKNIPTEKAVEKLLRLIEEDQKHLNRIR